MNSVSSLILMVTASANGLLTNGKAAPAMVWSQDDKGDFKGHMIGPHNGHGIGFGDLNNDGHDTGSVRLV